jgi:3-deoxy-D-manno-octulosonic-acid transferase
MLTRLVYNGAVVPLLWILFRLLGFVNAKAARGLGGRKNLFERLATSMSAVPAGVPRIWFHSSSMGEFEQAKPIITELKKKMPEARIVVSFFSPSGYEHCRGYALADAVTYIPFDSFANARRFVDIVRPSAAVIIRYDVWPNHLWALRRAGIPVLLSNATVQTGGVRDLPVIRQMYRSFYNDLDFIFPVSASDEAAVRSLRLSHPVIRTMGDTRYDQVLRRSRDSVAVQILAAEVTAGKKVLVAGSTWPEDEAVLLPACRELTEKRTIFWLFWFRTNRRPMRLNGWSGRSQVRPISAFLHCRGTAGNRTFWSTVSAF